MNTALPVYRGEIQCRMLGMAINAYSSATGQPCPPGMTGELVCTRPFPCQPVGFWPLPGFADGDSDALESAQKRHQAAYFSEFKDVWCEWSTLIFMKTSCFFFTEIFTTLYSLTFSFVLHIRQMTAVFRKVQKC